MAKSPWKLCRYLANRLVDSRWRWLGVLSYITGSKTRDCFSLKVQSQKNKLTGQDGVLASHKVLGGKSGSSQAPGPKDLREGLGLS